MGWSNSQLSLWSKRLAKMQTQKPTAPTRSEIKNVLIVEKLTKYEKLQGKNIPIQPGIVKTHESHTKNVGILRSVLEQHGIRVRTVKAQSLNTTALFDSSKDSLDAIISAGGDGTFLEAASLIGYEPVTCMVSGVKLKDVPATTSHSSEEEIKDSDNGQVQETLSENTVKNNCKFSNIWLFGINTDPEHSEGRLCVCGVDQYKQSMEDCNTAPDSISIQAKNGKTNEYTTGSIGPPIHKLPQSAELLSTFLKPTLQSENNSSPLNIYRSPSIKTCTVEEGVRRILTGHLKVITRQRISVVIQHANQTKTLSEAAVNDVFISASEVAESLYAELAIGPSDNWQPFKSSGFLAFTGTGSSAWAFNLQKITEQRISKILVALGKQTGEVLDSNLDLISLRDSVNSNLIFQPSVCGMRFVIREPIENRVFSAPRLVDEECEYLRLRPLNDSTYLYIDGAKKFFLSVGDIVTLECNPSNVLWTGK